ncbi:ran-binding protein 10-like [Iris pallida]|uniref:Ran-binding protein 10-like n=1 Tax=Iris pallida TaxID=29817 RepID=A0AAX6HJV9_IRIPA|nr:ran-binding protein 10-like [Iris pallida]
METNASAIAAGGSRVLLDAVDLFGLASRNPPDGSRPEDPRPSELNTLNSSGMFQLVSPDKMSVQYVGGQQHGHDVGAVQSDLPAPTRTLAYYFEMVVKNSGDKGQVSIGYTCSNYNLRRQPGWEANSCGYHGDDGYIYRGHGKGEPFGPTYTTGDTVGAGINYATQEFFFTKNGEIIGTIEKDIKGPLYPTVAVHSPNEEVTVNFGKESFCYDIERYKSEERLKQQNAIEKLSLPPNVSHWIIRSYLLHYGYQDTLKSLDIESEIPSPPTSSVDQGDAYALNQRKILRQLIRKGQIDLAFQNLRDWYPQVLQADTSTICFLLHSQRFIEFIKEDRLLDAVSYARAELQKFLKIKPFEGMLENHCYMDRNLLKCSELTTLWRAERSNKEAQVLKNRCVRCLGYRKTENAIALLAYEDPSKSCVGYLLKEAQLEFVADAVNAAILSTNPNLSNSENCMYSSLEKFLRQATACCLERRTLNDNQGEAFDLHKEQLRWGWGSPDV